MAGKRDETRRKMLDALPKNGVGAEVGVWEGRFSEVILEVCTPKALHLIDPWEYDPRFNNTGFGRKKNAERMPAMHEMVAEKFAADDRVHLHRATSAEALVEMEDGSLDWIYIDGNHNEPFVGMDLALATKKVRPGGVIAGDDYHWSDGEGTPVKAAVAKTVEKLGDGATLEVMGQQYIIRLQA
ncbi:hypothetical protein JANAI62_09560 [Jannaschia pagri]|uniref:Methyltransferase domain-containing protein n=1 Tax=Jannaschia pagri TaxID=2829797 RepID=A0ABQ4NIU2_9RHOB|nr:MULTISPECIES: class I SAM-dependent methyltransferase [unclassified Jannaschia]GIT89559.1 hypothetical protein JANAI61_00170 [Jannaschia sp. AI_61]GIT94333.1 hypothetical protein JANAI62_09560 [Jannaschia sp. AI_62]